MPASFKTLADSWTLQLRAEGKSPATLWALLRRRLVIPARFAPLVGDGAAGSEG